MRGREELGGEEKERGRINLEGRERKEIHANTRRIEEEGRRRSETEASSEITT